VIRSYDALAASCREQAERHVRNARRSDNLRDIVRQIAMASTLEQAARRLSSNTNVELHDIAKIVKEGLKLHMNCHRRPFQLHPPQSRTEEVGRASKTDSSNAAVESRALVICRKNDGDRLHDMTSACPLPGGEP
jgi:hypothetical protein